MVVSLIASLDFWLFIDEALDISMNELFGSLSRTFVHSYMRGGFLDTDLVVWSFDVFIPLPLKPPLLSPNPRSDADFKILSSAQQAILRLTPVHLPVGRIRQQVPRPPAPGIPPPPLDPVRLLLQRGPGVVLGPVVDALADFEGGLWPCWCTN